MEFPVRLIDKVNIQVFCYNTVHKGNHMDRVFYEDNTYNASCPECGSNEWLYRKNNAITKKGHFITFKHDDWPWGTNERKHYGIVRIDCTEEQAQEWCNGIRNAEKEAEANDYIMQANERRGLIVNNIRATMPFTGSFGELRAIHEAINETLKFDTQYLDLIWNKRQSENRAQIDYRPRKSKFDFEKVLSDSELKNWNNKKEFSKIINKETINMEEI